MFGFNTALKNKKYTINSFSNINYQNNVAYLYNQETKVDDKNTTTGLTLSERLNGAYRNDWFEFGLNGSISYTAERNKLRPDNNRGTLYFLLWCQYPVDGSLEHDFHYQYRQSEPSWLYGFKYEP